MHNYYPTIVVSSGHKVNCHLFEQEKNIIGIKNKKYPLEGLIPEICKGNLDKIMTLKKIKYMKARDKRKGQ